MNVVGVSRAASPQAQERKPAPVANSPAARSVIAGREHVPPNRSPVLIGDALAAARGGLTLIVLQTAVRVVALVAVFAVTRHLAPDQFGRYSSVAAIVLFAGFMADCGTSPAITRLVSRSPDEADRLLSGTLVVSLVLGMVAYALAVGFAVISYSTLVAADVAIGALAVPAASVCSSILGALDGRGLSARRACVTALHGLILAGGMIPVLMGTGVRAPIVAIAIAPWCGLGVAVLMARRAGLWRSGLSFDLPRTKAVLRMALPFAVSGGLTALTARFDVIFLSVITSPAETASYDLAVRFIEATTYVSTALIGPLLFILSRRMGAGDREGAERVYREAVRVMYLLGIPISVTWAVLARPVVANVLGPEFGAVGPPLAVMGAAQFLSFVIFVQGALVMSGHALRRGIAVGGFIAGVTVVLDVVLVPTFGPSGAAAATAASWVIGAVALLRFHRRTYGISTPHPPRGVLLAGLGLGAILVGLREAPIWVPLVLGALTYIAILVATGSVGALDRRRLQAILARRAG